MRLADSLVGASALIEGYAWKQAMPTYRLRFENDARGKAREIHFEGIDPHPVFTLLAKERKERRAELWEGQRRLGTVKRTSEDIWVLDADSSSPSAN